LCSIKHSTDWKFLRGEPLRRRRFRQLDLTQEAVSPCSAG
jgi:hypothetical protein